MKILSSTTANNNFSSHINIKKKENDMADSLFERLFSRPGRQGTFTNMSFRPGTQNNENGVVDKLANEGRPKLKFNFTVSFKFRKPIVVTNLKGEDETMDEMTFALKQASRPNPMIMYQDINFYNYRTKVATRVDYTSMQLMFYDDVENYAHNIYELYLKGISPIANIPKERASLLNSDGNNGLKNKDFNTDGIITDIRQRIDGGTGSIGPLPPTPGGEMGLIENICIRHFFFSRTERRDTPLTGVEAGNKIAENIQYVEYQFLNPKIVNMTLDELDMTQSDSNTMLLNFIYDGVYIDSPLGTKILQDERQSDENTFSIDDIRGKIIDVERLIKRIRRIDTLPDISVFDTADIFVPPITGTLPNIELPKPKVDLPPLF